MQFACPYSFEEDCNYVISSPECRLRGRKDDVAGVKPVIAHLCDVAAWGGNRAHWS